MNRPVPIIRRLLTGSQRSNFSRVHPHQRQIKAQSSPVQTSKEAKPRKQVSKTGTIVFVALGAVWTGYGAWALRDRDTNSKTLNTSTFTPFKIIDKESVSSTCSIFTLEQPAANASVIQDMWDRGVWSIDIKQPQLQIARSYTPLPPLDASAPPSQLRLLVRKERKGEMSNYIHNAPVNGSLEVRGPALECALPPEVDQIVFLAGGTGIAPAMQVAHAFQDSSNISILWGNRERGDCQGGKSDTLTATICQDSAGSWLSSLGNRLGMSTPQSYPPTHDGENQTASTASNTVVRQLDEMKKTGKESLKVDYFVDEEGTFIQPQHVSSILSQQNAPSSSPTPGEKLIFVSGSEGFLNYWAGPKVWREGREVQGPLGGVLSQMDLQGWKVIKL